MRATCGASLEDNARAPAANQHVAPGSELEHFLGRIARQALAADLPALAQRGAAFETVVNGAFPHVHVLGEVVLDELVQNHRQSQPRGYGSCNLPAAGPHFPRHCDDRHDVLLWFIRSTSFASSVARRRMAATAVAISQSNDDRATVWKAACRNGT